MVPLEKLDIKKDEVLSVFTVFATLDGIEVFIPSMEILLSSYVPDTHTILHDLVTLPLDNVIDKHVIDCIIIDDRVCDFKFKSEYARTTNYFLIYLYCNKVTRKNVSKLRSSLISNVILRGKIPYSYMEVFPYHPDNFLIEVLGLYDEKKKRFWVEQIVRYKLPSEYYIPKFEYEKTAKNKTNNTQKRLNNENEVTKELDLINNRDAGRNAGKIYIKSKVKAIFPLEKEYRVKKIKEGSKTLIGEAESCNPIAAAATPLNGQEASKPIAAVEYKSNDAQSGYLKMLLEIIEELKEEIYFLTDEAIRADDPVFCTLRKKKTFRGSYSNWAFVSKDKPRRLLVCELCLSGKYVYILDIERKKKESYAGIVFSLTHRLDKPLLKQIKDAISINQGRFGGDERRRKFPVDSYKTFRHYSDKTRMEKAFGLL